MHHSVCIDLTNGYHFTDDSFNCIFLNENVWMSIKISLKFVPKGQMNNIPALVQIMASYRPGDKPLSEPMMASLVTHICVTRPQWVKPEIGLIECSFLILLLKEYKMHVAEHVIKYVHSCMKLCFPLVVFAALSGLIFNVCPYTSRLFYYERTGTNSMKWSNSEGYGWNRMIFNNNT